MEDAEAAARAEEERRRKEKEAKEQQAMRDRQRQIGLVWFGLVWFLLFVSLSLCHTFLSHSLSFVFSHFSPITEEDRAREHARWEAEQERQRQQLRAAEQAKTQQQQSHGSSPRRSLSGAIFSLTPSFPDPHRQSHRHLVVEQIKQTERS